MKHPDRRRKRARSERIIPLPDPAAGPIAPSPLPSGLGGATPAAPAPPAPQATPSAAPRSRPKVGARLVVLLLVVGLCGVAGLTASRKTTTPATSSSPSPAAPTQPKVSKPAAPSPLATLEPIPALPSPEPQLSKPRPLERVNPEARVPGNGYPLLIDALAKVSPANVAATHQIHRTMSEPATPLGSEALRFVRESWPAIQEVEQAGRSESFAAVGSNILDFGKLDTVISSALAIAHMESATRVPLGREAVRMARLGHALAGSGALFDSAIGLAQARKAEKCLKTSLVKDAWNGEELAWIAGELDGLVASRASVTVGGTPAAGVATALEEKHKAELLKSADTEKHELDELCKLAHEKAAAGRKGT